MRSFDWMLLSVLLVGCAGAESGEVVEAPPIPDETSAARPTVAPWPTDEWPRATPAAQDLDTAQLVELTRLIRGGRRFPDLHSLLIVRNGYLVLEEYFDGWSADRLHTLQSVSKSFTSALVGIAIEHGALSGVDEKVLEFFPDVEIANRDAGKEAMRVEDLLTMRSGTDYDEGYTGSPHSRLNSLDHGWDRFVLDRPMVRPPGTEFQYDSGAVILTSAIIKSRTGMHADEYAAKHLFPMIGIDEVEWYKNQDGHPHTGGGLELRPRDMARFGLLYLRKGRWGDRQVVPVDWVESSTRRQVKFDRKHGRSTGYGYWWWIQEPDPQGAGVPIVAARGFRAQYIFLIEEYDMVVVVTGGARGADMRKPVEFLYTHILPAVRRGESPSAR